MSRYDAEILNEDGTGRVAVDLRTLDDEKLTALRGDANLNGDATMVETITDILDGTAEELVEPTDHRWADMPPGSANARICADCGAYPGEDAIPPEDAIRQAFATLNRVQSPDDATSAALAHAQRALNIALLVIRFPVGALVRHVKADPMSPAGVAQGVAQDGRVWVQWPWGEPSAERPDMIRRVDQ